MTNPSQYSIAHRIALLLVRLSLGIYMFSAGLHKAFMPDKSIGESAAAWMKGYSDRIPPFVPNFIAIPYGYAIPWLELILGLMLIAGLFFRVTTLATAFLLVSIGIAVASEKGSITGLNHHSIIMATFCLLLFFTGPGGFSIDAMIPKRRPR